MYNTLAVAMRDAVHTLREKGVPDAMREIREALASYGEGAKRGKAEPSAKRSQTPDRHEPVRSAAHKARSRAPSAMRTPLGAVVKALQSSRRGAGAFALRPGLGGVHAKKPAEAPTIPDGAQFHARSFYCPAGSRDYKLYVSAKAGKKPKGLVIMLHGCGQDPDDFAAGTGMNALAEAHGLIVAYPHQTGSANPSQCWNWFRPVDQKRDAGEPAIIAGITREIQTEFDLDRRKIFVAGLSAGGAMAAVMLETYPDLYAAAGIHSGLAFGAARDVMSALAAMRGDHPGGSSEAASRAGADVRPPVRTIVFHGESDQTVHPSNAHRIVANASSEFARNPVRREYQETAAGRSYSRLVIADPSGSSLVECWLVEAAGHAWSGGDPAGSYTDPCGPDASAEMVRFFLNKS